MLFVSDAYNTYKIAKTSLRHARWTVPPMASEPLDLDTTRTKTESGRSQSAARVRRSIPFPHSKTAARSGAPGDVLAVLCGRSDAHLLDEIATETRHGRRVDLVVMALRGASARVKGSALLVRAGLS